MNVKNINNLNKNKLTIVCSTNQKYLQYVKPFFNSLEKNSKNLNVVLRLVNCKNFNNEYKNFDLYKIYEYKDFKNKIITNFEDSKKLNYIELKEKIKKGKLGNSIFKRDEGVYCSNIKFNTINFLISNSFKHILYLDVDTIVNHNFDSIIQDSKNYDLAMFIDKNDINSYTTKYDEKYMGWNAGFMYINNTELSKNFYNTLEERVNKDIFNIEADEVEFQKLLSEIDIKILYVNKKYKDNGPDYDINSYMWSGQSDEKIINTTYRNKIKEYNEA
tara:strand:+ start:577 stop:1398 length:822 start_codon:yes stop_codon:yes gene_type:complete